MSNKRYYWLKLNENFFEDDTIEWLEEQENGKDYVIFYLKLCLRSLKDEGYLVRYVGEKLIPYDVKALSKITNTAPDTVAVSMKTFFEIGLISKLDSGEIYMNQINEMIGSETDSAKRMREKRLRDKQTKTLPSHSDNNVQISDTEIDIETEQDIEVEQETDREKDKEQKTVISCYSFFEQNGFGTISPNIRDQINQYIDDFIAKGSTEQEADQLIIEALKISDNNGVHHWKYVNSILNDWYQKGYKTVDDVKANEKKQKKQNSYSKKPIREESKPEWMDKEPEDEEEISDDEEQAMREQLKRIRGE